MNKIVNKFWGVLPFIMIVFCGILVTAIEKVTDNTFRILAMEQSKEQNFAHYSIQFACLQKLRKNGLISVDEYEAIKKRLMKDYKVISNLAA